MSTHLNPQTVTGCVVLLQERPELQVVTGAGVLLAQGLVESA